MTTEPAAPRPRWRRVLGSFWGQLLLAFLVVGLILTFLAKPYVVPSGSMLETLEPGDRILVNRIAFLGSEPVTGDIIVFDADDAWDVPASAPTDPIRTALRWVGEVTGFGPSGPHTLVKRVIGSSGEVVACCDATGAVLVDGRPIDEPYVSNDFAFEEGTLDCTTTPRSSRCFDEVTVPDESYLVLGDNRSGSRDSAYACRSADASDDCWRWASHAGIVGEVAAVLWPIPRWGALG
ncbi:signal peptidase I [Agromyces bracchium]|uniref:Signal peptidase I n=1 Tax=Agromyces bracchium TaxID=88376 RepID=A0A6I3M6E2_9MICO|nr:signal peptidase I [Agromyces bracchium]MTH66896.1 signal peptidase I [Agromyces bracchium]